MKLGGDFQVGGIGTLTPRVQCSLRKPRCAPNRGRGGILLTGWSGKSEPSLGRLAEPATSRCARPPELPRNRSRGGTPPAGLRGNVPGRLPLTSTFACPATMVKAADRPSVHPSGLTPGSGWSWLGLRRQAVGVARRLVRSRPGAKAAFTQGRVEVETIDC